jgi:hypothetical protein
MHKNKKNHGYKKTNGTLLREKECGQQKNYSATHFNSMVTTFLFIRRTK